MRKLFSVLVILAFLIVSVTGCAPKTPTTPVTPPQPEPATTYKIGLMTGTVSQGEEEYRAAEALVKKIGADKIIHRTYPDRASSEVETTISTMLSLAADPDVKAIVACYAAAGTIAAFERVREARPDILLIAGLPTEDPYTVAEVADVVLSLDYVGLGAELAETASEMGATTFVHYSFPRHMSNPILAEMRSTMQAKCEELGIKFVIGTSPDPQGEGGVSSTQQFILEDVPRKILEYGKDTAFFGTNTAQWEPLIKSIYENGGIFPNGGTPSPFAAYPGALGIEVPEDKAGDADYMVAQISAKLAQKGMTGRMGTWMPPSLPLVMDSAVNYAIDYIEGNYPDRLNVTLLEEILKKIGGARIIFKQYDENINNFFVILNKTIKM